MLHKTHFLVVYVVFLEFKTNCYIFLSREVKIRLWTIDDVVSLVIVSVCVFKRFISKHENNCLLRVLTIN